MTSQEEGPAPGIFPRTLASYSPLFVRSRLTLLALAVILGVLAQLTERWLTPPTPPVSRAVTSQATETEAVTDEYIRFYSERVKRDPEDCRSQNALSEYYLQRVRETGNEDYLPLAVKAAQSSLDTVPAARNLGGLLALAHAEFSNHAFSAARQHAEWLIQLEPDKGEYYAVLGDAALELGDYDTVKAAYGKMQSLQEDNAGTATRLARLALVNGKPEEARRHLQVALRLLGAMTHPPHETINWCRWQLGEIAFMTGSYPEAEKEYRAILKTSPSYFRALDSLARARAAQHDYSGAISCYETVIRIVPTLAAMASLGDLYHLTGREPDAVIRYDLVAQLGEHSRKVHGTPYDRNFALFLADHDQKPEFAYELARSEYDSGRHDIYGADALAWTALKAGRVQEAEAASKEALRLTTKDSKLFYHAGMVARAAGDKSLATSYLQRALALSPEFDPAQAAKARAALAAK